MIQIILLGSGCTGRDNSDYSKGFYVCFIYDRAAYTEKIPEAKYTMVSLINNAGTCNTVTSEHLQSRYNHDHHIEVILEGRQNPQGSDITSYVEGNKGAYFHLFGTSPEDCFQPVTVSGAKYGSDKGKTTVLIKSADIQSDKIVLPRSYKTRDQCHKQIRIWKNQRKSKENLKMQKRYTIFTTSYLFNDRHNSRLQSKNWPFLIYNKSRELLSYHIYALKYSVVRDILLLYAASVCFGNVKYHAFSLSDIRIKTAVLFEDG